jgi:16S rRNA (guanine527-N7)-methyltransferase
MEPEPLPATEVAARLKARRLAVDSAEAEALATYLRLLEHWNRVHNLTGIRDRLELIDRHLVESLVLAPFITGPEVADIGSGAGLPGLPLALRCRDLHFTLIESRRKRVSFLRHVVATLGLGNVTVAHGRAEALALPPFATVLARAVAPPAELLTLVTPMLAAGGRLVLLAGADKGREIAALAAGYRPLPVTPPVDGLRSHIVVLERLLS